MNMQNFRQVGKENGRATRGYKNKRDIFIIIELFPAAPAPRQSQTLSALAHLLNPVGSLLLQLISS
jgi:hypothetical protein